MWGLPLLMIGLELTCISSEVEMLSTWQELEITFGTGGLALPKFGGEKKPATSATSWKPPNATITWWQLSLETRVYGILTSWYVWNASK